MQFWLLKTVHGVFQYLKDTIQMWLLPLALKIIFAREDIIVLNHQLKEKQCFVQREHTGIFLELVNLPTVQFAQLDTTAQIKQWILSLALWVTIVP